MKRVTRFTTVKNDKEQNLVISLEIKDEFVVRFYRKIHYQTKEFRVKLHAKTDIARIAKR